jgi:hypothetical protein
MAWWSAMARGIVRFWYLAFLGYLYLEEQCATLRLLSGWHETAFAVNHNIPRLIRNLADKKLKRRNR